MEDGLAHQSSASNAVWADWSTAKSQLSFPFPTGKADIPFFSSSHSHSSVSPTVSLSLFSFTKLRFLFEPSRNEHRGP